MGSSSHYWTGVQRVIVQYITWTDADITWYNNILLTFETFDMFLLHGSLARCSTSFWLGQAANVSQPSFPAPRGSSTNLKGQKHTGFPLLQQTAERNQQFSIHKLSFILLGFTPFPNTPASFYYSRAGAWGTRVRAAQLSVLNLQLFDLLSIHQKSSIQQSPNHNQLSGALAPWYLKPNDTTYLQPVGAAAN